MFWTFITISSLLSLVNVALGRVDGVLEEAVYKNAVAVGDDWGHLDNCGDPQHNFTFQWKPKKFRVGDDVTFNLDFVAQTDIIQVTAWVTVWAKGIKDPIIKTDVEITCAQIKKYFPQYSKFCPLKKGQQIPLKGITYHIPDSYPIPAGTYIVRLDAKDQDEQPVVCAKGEIQTLDPPPVNWDDWRR